METRMVGRSRWYHACGTGIIRILHLAHGKFDPEFGPHNTYQVFTRVSNVRVQPVNIGLCANYSFQIGLRPSITLISTMTIASTSRM